MKIPHKYQHTYRYKQVEIRGQLYHQTISTKALGKNKKYNWNPRTFACRNAPPSDGDGHPEQDPQTADEPELHRFKAFRRAAVEARPRGRTKGSAADPLAGDAPAILEADLVGVSQKEIERGNL